MNTIPSISTNIRQFADIFRRTVSFLVAATFILGLPLAQGQQNPSPSSPPDVASQKIGNAFVMGEAAFKQKNYVRAEKYFLSAANKGDPVAQTYLGVIYLKGLDGYEDYPKALNFFQQAAEQGVAIAQKYLGDIYINGIGVPQDFVKAAEYYHTSAVLADLPTPPGLDYLYLNGEEVQKDLNKAKERNRMAAIQGNRMALALLQREGQQLRNQCIKACFESYNTGDCIANWGTVDICRSKLLECGGVCNEQVTDR